MGELIELFPCVPEEPVCRTKTVLLRTDTGDGDCNVAFAAVALTPKAADALLVRLLQFERATTDDHYLVELVFFDLTPRLIRYSSETSGLLDMIEAPGPGYVVIEDDIDLRAATLAPARWSRLHVAARGLSWTIRPRQHDVIVRTGAISGSALRGTFTA